MCDHKTQRRVLELDAYEPNVASNMDNKGLIKAEFCAASKGAYK